MFPAINGPTSLGYDAIGIEYYGADPVDSASEQQSAHAFETLRRLQATGYGQNEQWRPDLASDINGPEYFGGEYFGGEYFGKESFSSDDMFGWNPFKAVSNAVSSAVGTVTKTAKKAVSTVGKIPGVSTAFAPLRLARDIASGKNVVSSVRNQAVSVVRDTRASLPMAASVVSFVPGAGQVVGSGLSGLAALSEGKSLQDIVADAAIGAVPGGPLVKSALTAGMKVARGENVIQSLAQEGINYARTQLPGGQLAQQALTSGYNIARGGNVLSEVQSVAMRNAGPLANQLVKSPLVKVVREGAALQFPRSVSPAAAISTINAVSRAAESSVPEVARSAYTVIHNTRQEANRGNPGAQVAIGALQEAIQMRAQVRAARASRPRPNSFFSKVRRATQYVR